MKLFELVDYNHPLRKLGMLVKKLGDRSYTVPLIYESLGETQIANAIVRDLNIIDNSDHYSLWCLSYYGVNSLVIYKLKDYFYDLDMMAIQIIDLHRIGFHDTNIKKIKNAINDLRLNVKCELEADIINIIKSNEPLTNIYLKNIIFNKYHDVNTVLFNSLIDSMIERNLISYNIDGYKIKRIDIKTCLEESTNEKDKCILIRCNGKTLKDCSIEFGLSGERVRQLISKQILKLPVFYKEKDYFAISQKYDLRKNDAEVLEFDMILWNYVSLKYGKANSEKNVIDYLKDNDMCDSDVGKRLFAIYHLIVIDNEIVCDDFIHLFTRYLYKRNLVSFNVIDISNDFNSYIKANMYQNEDCFITKENLNFICRKLEKNEKYLNIGSKNFLLFDEDSLSSDFIIAVEQYLESFEGYGSVKLFFEKNKEMCNHNRVNDEKELFVIIKKIFSEKFKDRIEFIRNPTIATKGIDREQDIENLLLDLELPCSVEVYLDYIKEIKGLNQTSVASSFSNIINKYKNVDGLLSLNNEYTDEDKEKFITLLNNRDCIGANLFEFEVKRVFKDKPNIFLNSNTIKKFGYCKTSTSIYKDIFSSRLNAVQNALSHSEIILTEALINKFTNLNYLTNKMFESLDECLVLKIGNNKYLNIVARNQQESVKELKNDLLNLLDDEEIYVLDDFLESALYLQFINQDKEYNSILYSFNTREIIKFIFETTNGFYYLQQADTFLVCKQNITYDSIINRIMTEREKLSLCEFKEVLFEYYGITKSFSNADLTNRGYYCPYTSEKVYLSKKYYEYEMEEYLNGNS
ncbi:MAG: hypothetical protein RR266_02255 [Bacilli bacterium]